MITKMKKLTFLVYHKEYEEFLNSLRELGVVHIVEKQQGAADNTELQENIRLFNRLAATLKLLQNQKHEKNAVIATEGGTATRGMQVLDEVDALQTEHGKLSQQLQSYAKEKEVLEVWGNFEPTGIQKLKDAGYIIGFYSCSEGNYKEEWETEYNAMIVNRISSKVFFVTVTKAGQEVDLDVEQAKLPAYSLSRLEALYDTTEQAIEGNEKKLVALSETDIPSLKAALKELQSQIEFSKVVLSSEQTAGDKLMLIEGWAPAYSKVEIEAYLNDAHVYYEITDPMPGDNVPIRLNNKGFFAWFEPICKLYMLPKYNELDLTPFFAPFFMLFFGLCFGDGGYGLLVMIACTILKKKVNPDFKPYLTLFQYLGFAALLVGTCTGSFFGVALADIPALSKIKNYFVNSDNLMTFSIVIGLVQIIFGKCVAAYKIKIQKGTKHSIAPFAWVFVIISLALAFGLPMLNVHLPNAVVMVCYGIAILGLVIAYLYNTPGKNVFLNFGTGLWNTYNMASGLLGDTLSYIRLFAIGLTGSILGGVFNTLAVTMTDGMNIVARAICMLLILLVGHSINIALCTISSLVHPLRLIFVEYYKNAEFEGGGKAYEPFRKA
mgnify:CR=1 FL=1